MELMLPIRSVMDTVRALYRANPPPLGGDSEAHMARLRDEAWRIVTDERQSRNQSSGGRSGRSGLSANAGGRVREVLRAEEALAGMSPNEASRKLWRWSRAKEQWEPLPTKPADTDGSECRPPSVGAVYTPLPLPSPCLLQVKGCPPPPCATPISKSNGTAGAAPEGSTATSTPTVSDSSTDLPELQSRSKESITIVIEPGPYVISPSDYRKLTQPSKPTPNRLADYANEAAACEATSDEP